MSVREAKPFSAALVAEIVANPERFGFRWITGEVYKDSMSMGSVPLVEHTDTDLLAETFGDAFILKSLDGTSRHVTNQGICRDARWADRKISAETLKVLIVENMLGKRSPRKVTVVERRIYVAYDDTEFQTKEERDEYNALLKAEGKV